MAPCCGRLWSELLQRLEWQILFNRLRADAASREVPLRIGLVASGGQFRLHVHLAPAALASLFQLPVGVGGGTHDPAGSAVSRDEAREAAALLVRARVDQWTALDRSAFYMLDRGSYSTSVDSSMQPCCDRTARWQRARWLIAYLALLNCDSCVLHALALALQRRA